jgi:hypothetical protein
MYSYKRESDYVFPRERIKKTGLKIFSSIIIILTWETERGLGNIA